MVLVLMMMRVTCLGGLTPPLLVLVVKMIEGCLGGAGIGGVGGRQSENLRSCGNFWLGVVIVLVVVLKLTHIKLLFGFSRQK